MRGLCVTVFVSLAALGCGGSSGTPAGGGDAAAGTTGATPTTAGPHGCTNIQGSCSANMGVTCSEWAGYDAATLARFKSGCDRPGEAWSDAPCDKSASVGGCSEVVGGVCAVAWSNPPVTAAALQADCTGQYQTFVTP